MHCTACKINEKQCKTPMLKLKVFYQKLRRLHLQPKTAVSERAVLYHVMKILHLLLRMSTLVTKHAAIATMIATAVIAVTKYAVIAYLYEGHTSMTLIFS